MRGLPRTEHDLVIVPPVRPQQVAIPYVPGTVRHGGNVDTPAQGRVTHVGSDFVLGIGEDEVEQVRMYRLVKEE